MTLKISIDGSYQGMEIDPISRRIAISLHDRIAMYHSQDLFKEKI